MHRRKYETFAPVFQASFEQTEQAGQSYSNKHNKSDKVIRTNRTSRTKLFEKTGQARQSYSNKLDKSDKVIRTNWTSRTKFASKRKTGVKQKTASPKHPSIRRQLEKMGTACQSRHRNYRQSKCRQND
jgi:cytochrome c556